MISSSSPALAPPKSFPLCSPRVSVPQEVTGLHGSIEIGLVITEAEGLGKGGLWSWD